MGFADQNRILNKMNKRNWDIEKIQASFSISPKNHSLFKMIRILFAGSLVNSLKSSVRIKTRPKTPSFLSSLDKVDLFLWFSPNCHAPKLNKCKCLCADYFRVLTNACCSAVILYFESDVTCVFSFTHSFITLWSCSWVLWLPFSLVLHNINRQIFIEGLYIYTSLTWQELMCSHDVWNWFSYVFFPKKTNFILILCLLVLNKRW